MFLFLISIYPALGYGQTETPLWTEDFEGNWVFDWSVTAGTWQVGDPSTGPGSAFVNTRCAATVLDGNYPEGVNSRLKRLQLQRLRIRRDSNGQQRRLDKNI
jgi:hypothetical protein